MSAPNKLAPSRSTVYLSNLPYSLTNNDIHQLVEQYGRIVRVTIVKDRQNRRSRGVAFVLFLQSGDATACISALNGKNLFGRQLKASLARDNGRAPEFIRRREYPDKSRCYECGASGHLSYSCDRNTLGERQPPAKKSSKRRRKAKRNDTACGGENMDAEDVDLEAEESDEESLAAAIAHQHSIATARTSGSCSTELENGAVTRTKKYVRNSYFSDEEDEEAG